MAPPEVLRVRETKNSCRHRYITSSREVKADKGEQDMAMDNGLGKMNYLMVQQSYHWAQSQRDKITTIRQISASRVYIALFTKVKLCHQPRCSPKQRKCQMCRQIHTKCMSIHTSAFGHVCTYLCTCNRMMFSWKRDTLSFSAMLIKLEPLLNEISRA